MRFIVKILVLLALILGAWWWVATTGMQRGVERWIKDREAEGLDVSVAQMERGGFPFRIATRLTDTKLTDPDVETTLTLPQIDLSSPIYWPGYARAQLAEKPITLTSPQGVMTLTAQAAKANMHLHPGTSLQLETLTAQSGAMVWEIVEGQLMSLQSAQINVAQGNTPDTYHLDLSVDGLAFGSVLQQALDLPASWPRMFEPVVANMTVKFDQPWDRSALGLTRPQPRSIEIERLEVTYASFGAAISGDLTVDRAGIPTGVLSVRMTDWQTMLERATAASLIDASVAPTVQSILGAMSDANGHLNLDVILQGGQMRVGFFPLGPAPRIVIP